MATKDFPTVYKNFILKKKINIPEIQSILFELEHTNSKAKLFHISHEDDENLFSLSFKTYPQSSNGIAHILEHTVLCGSKKFPVKDPFFAMTRRSLNTFMNAMTGMDFTCYPAASQNKKDFYNLLDVYLDAVFNPILDERSFRQEGHRFEFQSKYDTFSPLTIQGIVYNEMKGGMNSPESRLYRYLYKELFTDLTYQYNSGGDPKEITNLSYEELKEFHSTYYHPSRCIFFFYGNIPLESHLDFLEEKILSSAQSLPDLPSLKNQHRFLQPKTATYSYPVSEKADNQDFLAIGFLTVPIQDQLEFLALCLLDEILMESDASFLKKRLQDSKLLVQADSFIDGEMSELPFVFIIRGTDVKNANSIENLLLTSLQEFISKPISYDLIEAALHQMELDRLEITDENGPYGLSLFLRSILIMQHGANPEDGLFVHTLFHELREKLKNSEFLPNIIKKHFLNNNHRVLLSLKADEKLESQENLEEVEKLKIIKSQLTQKELKEIVENTKKLEQFQKKQENIELNVLPELQIEDISLEVKNFPLQKWKKDQMMIYHHDTWTNQFVYIDVLYDLPEMRKEEWPLLKFLLSILTELGAKDRSFEENLQLLQAKTGGMQTYFQILTYIDKPSYIRPMIGIKGKCLEQNLEPFFQLMKDFLIEPNLNDEKRIKDLILQTYTYLRDKLNRSGLGYCIKHAFDGSSLYNTINNSMSGLPYYQFIEKLTIRAESDLSGLLEELKNIKNKIFHFNQPQLIISSDLETVKFLDKKDFFDLGKIPTSAYSPWIGSHHLERSKNAHLEISSSVAFVCEAFSVFGIDDPLSPALTLATYIMENAFLHPIIREQGGAYGASATYQPLIGNFYFHSYRDPNISDTYIAFNEAISKIIEEDLDESLLKDAKFEFIQDFDAPITPGIRAQTAFFQEKTGRTKEFRENYKKKILSVTLQDVKNAVEKAFSKKTGTKVFACSTTLADHEKQSLQQHEIIFNSLKFKN